MAKKDKAADQVKEEVEATTEAVSVPELFDFDVWHAMREKFIPKQHLKEIIKADFKGQKLSDKEELATFDKALASYGIKL